jgi:hypothetical protein
VEKILLTISFCDGDVITASIATFSHKQAGPTTEQRAHMTSPSPLLLSVKVAMFFCDFHCSQIFTI